MYDDYYRQMYKDVDTTRVEIVERRELLDRNNRNTDVKNHETLLGAIVAWKEDLNLLPNWLTPAGYNSALIQEYEGVVHAIDRTLFGNWVCLVYCRKTEKFKEKKLTDLQIIETKNGELFWSYRAGNQVPMH